MKTLKKAEYVRRWLRSGKSLTPNQARIRWNADRLAVIVNRMRKSGEWIINIGQPGKYAKYLWFEKGPIKGYMVMGFRFEILDAHFIDGFADMEIKVKAENGYMWEEFTVTSHEFRSVKNMKAALKEHLNKVEV